MRKAKVYHSRRLMTKGGGRCASSNEGGAEGLVYALVLDDLHTRPERTSRVRQLARQFVEKWLGEGDLATVTTTSGGTEASSFISGFTGNRQVLLEAIDKFSGRSLRSMTLEVIELREEMLSGMARPEIVALQLRTLDQEHAFRARTTLSHLRSMSEILGDIEGRRKVILYFGEGVPYDMEDFIQGESADTVALDIRRVVGSTGLSNVSIYTLDVRGLSAGQENNISVSRLSSGGPRYAYEVGVGNDPLDPRVQKLLDAVGLESQSFAEEARRSHDYLRVLASETGGLAAVNRNDFEQALSRVAADNRRFYQLGYTPPNVTADDRFRKIEVRVKGRDLKVRARKGYIVPKKEDRHAEIAESDGLDIGSSSMADHPLSANYMDLLRSYCSGHFEEARNHLATWTDDSVKKVADQLRLSTADPGTLQAAVLLHTELSAYNAWGLPAETRALHFQAAEAFVALIPGEKAFKRDWLLTAAYLYHGSNLSVSLNFLKEAAQRFPDDAEILLATGVTYETSAAIDRDPRMLTEAEKLYRRSIKANSDLAEAHLRLGKVLQERGGNRTEEAILELEWVVRNSSDPYLLYLANLFLGDLHKSEDNFVAAVAFYRAAVTSEPRWQPAQIALSYALRALGDRSAATDVMQKALRLPVSDKGYIDGYRLYSLGQFIAVVYVVRSSQSSEARVFSSLPRRTTGLPQEDQLYFSGPIAVYASKQRDKFLRRVADESGGRFIEIDGVHSMKPEFGRALDEIKSRYLLTYYPKGVDREGWHDIDVKLKNRKADLRARRGYTFAQRRQK